MAIIPFLNNAFFAAKVGIGIESPAGKLQIDGTAGTNELLLIKNTDTGGVASALTIEGIGSSSSIIDLNRGVAGRIAGTRYSTSGTTDFFSGLYYNGGTAQSNFGIGTDKNSANQKLVITTAGNVGIGTTSPIGKLEVVTTDANRYIRFKAPNGEERFQFYTGGTGNASALYMYSSNGTLKNVQIAAGGTSYFNAGNVGIGTTSPSQSLEVHSTIKIGESGVAGGKLISADSMIFQIDSDNNSGTSSYRFRANATDDTGTELMRIQEDGNVGIGTTSPLRTLSVFSSSIVSSEFKGSNAGMAIT